MLSTLVNHTLPMDSGQRRAILLAVKLPAEPDYGSCFFLWGTLMLASAITLGPRPAH